MSLPFPSPFRPAHGDGQVHVFESYEEQDAKSYNPWLLSIIGCLITLFKSRWHWRSNRYTIRETHLPWFVRGLLQKVPQTSSFPADGLESVLVRLPSSLGHDCNYANANDSSEAAAGSSEHSKFNRVRSLALRKCSSLSSVPVRTN